MSSWRPGAIKALVCDLDGVVYRGGQACPGAVAGLSAAREAGLAVLFLTNNAGHTPEGIVAHLHHLGIPARVEEVLTSSAVAAAYLAQHRDTLRTGSAPGAHEDAVVLAVGGPGVRTSLERTGLATVAAAELADGQGPPVWAVVQGYGPEVNVRDLTEAAYAIAAGATWLATNTDATLPSERGLAPGNGSLLAAVSHATGREPDLVVGKPHPPAYAMALNLLGVPADRVLAIGDRLETDIAGANAAGMHTALVLTGVHGQADVDRAEPGARPDVVVPTIPDLGLAAG